VRPTLPLSTALLCVVAAALGATFVYEVLAPPPSYDLPFLQPRAILPAAEPRDVFKPPSPETYASLEERPPFNPARTPFKTGEATAEKQPLPPPDIVLVGIILVDKQRIAIAKVPGARTASNLLPGQFVDGWQVTAIESDRIALRAESETYEIKLRPVQPSAAAPGTSTAAPGVGQAANR
jgi:hypothetical protein